MTRLFTSTRGISSWRDRLASPERQWRRQFSAFETAVSWESASSRASGLPAEVEQLLESHFSQPVLLLGVAEHKVSLPGGNAASQSDVWAVVNTTAGLLSLTVEAKALEPFGDDTLEKWLVGTSERSIKNRKERWEYLCANLPQDRVYLDVRYQILHRCAAAVIEAKRLRCPHAAFIVQAFNAPAISFTDFGTFCSALKLPAERGKLATTWVGDISLSIGWTDCLLGSDAAVAATA